MGFWSDKLAGGAPRTATPPAPMYTPPPSAPAQVPTAPQPLYDPYTGQPLQANGHAVATQDPQQPGPGQISAMDALNRWRGKRGQSDAKPCPSCGGPNYFSRYNPDQPSRNGPPMPQCFSCGYPIQQFGSATGTGGAMQATQGAQAGGGAPPRAAREAELTTSGFHPEIVVARVN